MTSKSDLMTPQDEIDALRDTFLAAQAKQPASFTATPASPSPVLKAAWDSYYAAIDELRRALENTSMFQAPQDRAKAYHQLLEIQAFAYNVIVAPRLESPRVIRNTNWQTDIYAVGLIAPDIVYGKVLLDSAQTYVLSGHIGDAAMMIIQSTNELHSLGADKKAIGRSYLLDDMDVADDGYYEIRIGGPEQPRNWIPLDPAVSHHSMLIRRIFRDPGHDDQGDIRIRRVTPVDRRHYDFDEFDEAAMAERLRRAEAFVRLYVMEFVIGIYDFTMAGTDGQVHAMTLMPGGTLTAGSPLSRYAIGRFSIREDEAVIIDLETDPDSFYWGFMLGDTWSRALSFNTWQTALNSSQIRADSDGGMRLVIAAKDPGIANWLDSTGHDHGSIVFRNYAARQPTVPTMRLVKFADLPALLPHAVPVTQAERDAALEHRRAGYLRLYGE